MTLDSTDWSDYELLVKQALARDAPTVSQAELKEQDERMIVTKEEGTDNLQTTVTSNRTEFDWLYPDEWAKTGEKEMIYNVWDFGGDPVNHHTHNILFSNSCIYLLVLNASQDNYLERMSFWLRSIWGYSDQTHFNNIVIVVTHTDKLGPKEVDDRRQEIISHMESISTRVTPTKEDVMMVSCKDGICNGKSSIDPLKEWLTQTASRMTEGRDYSAKSALLLDDLTNYESMEFFNASIELKELIIRGRRFKMTADEIIAALKWYHQLRFVFHWDEAPSEFRHKVFLKPPDLVNAFRTIITFNHNSHDLILENGKISNQILDRVWHEFGEDERDSLKELFINFGLAIRKADGLEFPCLVKRSLPKEPNSMQSPNNSRFALGEIIRPLGFTARLAQHLILSVEKQWPKMTYEIYANGVIVVVEDRLKARILVGTDQSQVEIIEVQGQLVTSELTERSMEDIEKEMEVVWYLLRTIAEFIEDSSKSTIASLTSTCLECFQENSLKIPMTASYSFNCPCRSSPPSKIQDREYESQSSGIGDNKRRRTRSSY